MSQTQNLYDGGVCQGCVASDGLMTSSLGNMATRLGGVSTLLIKESPVPSSEL